MCLHFMKDRAGLKGDQIVSYSNVEHFMKDFKLMIVNMMNYNEKTAEEARKFEKRLVKRLSELIRDPKYKSLLKCQSISSSALTISSLVV